MNPTEALTALGVRPAAWLSIATTAHIPGVYRYDISHLQTADTLDLARLALEGWQVTLTAHDWDARPRVRITLSREDG